MTSRIDVRPACGQCAAVHLFYFSHGLVRVCEINRIHHWCSVGTGITQPKGPPFQWETRFACLCTRLFICAMRSPAGKGLTSWLSFVVSYCEFVTFLLVWYMIVSIPDLCTLTYFAEFPA